MRKLSLAFLVSLPLAGQTYTVSTVAGGGIPVNIPATSADLPASPSVAVDAKGNVYFSGFYTVLRMDAATRILTLVAGNATPGFSGDNGPAASAQLTQPNAVAVDSAGNVYIADGNRIRKVSNGIITTIAGNGTAGATGDGGPAVSAEVAPLGLAFDLSGSLYFTNSVPNMAGAFPGFAHLSTVRKISQGVVTTVAGNGTCCGITGDGVPATSTPLYELTAIAVDSSGNLYVPSTTNTNIGNIGAIYKISGGAIDIIAGGPDSLLSTEDGFYPNPPYSEIAGIAVDSAGNIYIADYLDYRVREISGGAVATIAGNGTFGYSGDGGPATSAQVTYPDGIAVDSAGNLYVSEIDGRIREISKGIITTAAGNGTFGFGGDNGPATSAQLYLPQGIAVDSAGNLYIADEYNNRVREVSNGIMTTLAGSATQGYAGDGGPATAAGLFMPQGVTVDSAGNVYIADTDDGRVREVSNGAITTAAGNLGHPTQVTADGAGNVYISDANGVRKLSGGIVSSVAGNGTIGFSGDGGPATSAQLFAAYGIAVDSAGSVYIADAGNNRIRKVSNGIITTVAGNGTAGYSGDNGPATSGALNGPQSIAVDTAGNLYIADTNNYSIRKVSNGVIATIAGTGTAGFSGAQIEPTDIAVDSGGNVYFSEQYAYRVRVLKPCFGQCPPQAAPAIAAVVNGASFQPGIAAGSWVTIQGANLANTIDQVATGSLPTALDGVSVSIDGKPAFVDYVSPTQINVQAPSDSAIGPVSVVVTNNGAASAPAPAQLEAAAPAFFLYSGTNYAIASRLPDYAEVGDPSAPAKPGDTVVLWGTGFGATSPAVPAGTTVSGVPVVVPTPTVTVGGVPVTVVSALLTSGCAGLYQVTIELPANVPAGAVAVEASAGGSPSPAGVLLFVAGQ